MSNKYAKDIKLIVLGESTIDTPVKVRQPRPRIGSQSSVGMGPDPKPLSGGPSASGGSSETDVGFDNQNPKQPVDEDGEPWGVGDEEAASGSNQGGSSGTSGMNASDLLDGEVPNLDFDNILDTIDNWDVSDEAKREYLETVLDSISKSFSETGVGDEGKIPITSPPTDISNKKFTFLEGLHDCMQELDPEDPPTPIEVHLGGKQRVPPPDGWVGPDVKRKLPAIRRAFKRVTWWSRMAGPSMGEMLSGYYCIQSKSFRNSTIAEASIYRNRPDILDNTVTMSYINPNDLEEVDETKYYDRSVQANIRARSDNICGDVDVIGSAMVTHYIEVPVPGGEGTESVPYHEYFTSTACDESEPLCPELDTLYDTESNWDEDGKLVIYNGSGHSNYDPSEIYPGLEGGEVEVNKEGFNVHDKENPNDIPEGFKLPEVNRAMILCVEKKTGVTIEDPNGGTRYQEPVALIPEGNGGFMLMGLRETLGNGAKIIRNGDGTFRAERANFSPTVSSLFRALNKN